MYFPTRYLLFVLFPILTSCNTLQPEPNGLVNYGFVNSVTNDSLKFYFQLPADFNFTKVKLTPAERKLLFTPYQLLYAAKESILTKYKTVALEYPDSDLHDFSNRIILKLRQNSKVDSLHELRNEYTRNFIEKNSSFLLNGSTPFRVYEYILKKNRHARLHLLEQHLINPVTKKAIRIIWMADFDKFPKDIIAKNSLYESSASALSFLSFLIPDKDPFWLASSNFNLNSGYNYCLPLNLLNSISKKYVKAPFQQRSGYLQAEMTYASFAGDFKAARTFDSKLFKFYSDSADVKRIADFDTISAAKFILEAAKKQQIVMFNEAHHWPQCRAFVRDMLAGMKAIGYNKLALEALSNDSSAREDFQQPNQNLGLYTSEPVYGQLLREAHQLGFTVIAYEDTVKCRSKEYKDCINQREQNEAQNLYNTLQKDKDKKGKLIVLAGYDHIKKKQIQDRNPMAYELMKLSGITPLCFDLSKYYEKETKGAQSEIYTTVQDKYKMVAPVILIDKNKIPFVNHEDQGLVDANVFLPKGELEKSEFPQWYKQNNVVEYLIKLKTKAKKRLFLQVFLKEEIQNLSWNAVPVINHFLEKGTRELKVPLIPNKQYTYFIKDSSNNKSLENGTITL